LIEDDDGHAELVRRTLVNTGDFNEIRRVSRLAEATRCFDTETFDVILADLTLPDSEPMETVTTLCERVPQTPLVMLTALADDRVAMSALQSGAQDYLTKDGINSDILRSSIRYAIQRHGTTRENLRLMRRLKEGKRLLKRKNRRLARLYRTAQQFVDNVSHEFRTPLTVIKEYASLIDEGLIGPVNAEQQRMLNVVIDRSDDLNTMVDDLLDVSKLESGLLCAWRKNCRLEEVVHNVLPGIERKAALQSIRLESDLEPGLADVYCDGDKVARVLINLLVNAIKFSEPQGLVRLWARNHGAGNEVVVGVTDEGPGIAAEHLECIFDRFQQAGAGARASTKGVGLGLCIAKELAEINLGAIAVESELGHGSTFTFTIPMACPAEAASRLVKRLATHRRDADRVTILCGQVDESLSRELCNDVDAFFNYLLRRDDLLFRTGPREWLFLLPIGDNELAQFLERLESTRQNANRNRPNGPLPEISLAVAGVFSARSQQEELVATVARYAAAKEVICV